MEERIEEIGAKQSQSDVWVRHALEKPKGFGQNLKLERPEFECRTFIVNEFWKSALKKLGQNSIKMTFGYAMPSRNQQVLGKI